MADVISEKQGLKIAMLIITTSNKRDNWTNIKESYLYIMTLKTFLFLQKGKLKTL